MPGIRFPAVGLGANGVHGRPGERVVAGAGPGGSEDALQEHGRVLDHAEKDRACAEQAGRDRALERLRGAGVGQAGRQHGRRQPVLGERYEDGVQEHRLLRRRRSAPNEQVRELGKRDLAHELAREVTAADGDRVGIGAADVGT